MRDQLDDDALAARKAGMHYGDYMAAKREAAQICSEPLPKRVCVICGSPLVRRKQTKYCSEECRVTAQKRKRR